MKCLYITFGGSAYEKTTQEIVSRAPFLGADDVKVYDDYWLRQQEFYTLNKWLFDLPGVRGLCWFAWKPFIIMHALENFCEPGDIVLFTDGDTYPIADLTPLYDKCAEQGGQMVFAASGCSNRDWVKADTWITMAADYLVPGRKEVVLDSQHAVARFMLFQQSANHNHVRQFLMEWQAYCLNPLATTFDKSILGPELPCMREPRTEQAIFSLLAHKYGYHLHREADEFGNGMLALGEDAWYPQTFRQVWGDGPRTQEGSRFRNV